MMNASYRRIQRYCVSRGYASRTEAACDIDNQDNGENYSYEERLNEAIAKSSDIMHRAKDEYGAPGIIASVSLNGRSIWSEGIGYSDIENRVACTPSTVYRIGSISKPLTMVAVARLIEEGKLDIDKVIQEYVSTFPEKTWKGEKVDITTRHLLSNLGGIRHYNKDYIHSNQHDSTKNEERDKTKRKSSSLTGIPDMKNPCCENKNKIFRLMSEAEKMADERFQEYFAGDNCDNITKALNIFKDDPLVLPPGAKFLYTTYGWTLISAVLETAGGKPFLKQMADIFKDLDMNHTVPDEHTPIIYNRARGYFYNKHGHLVNSPHVNLSAKWAGGGYLSTVNDLIKFGNAMLYSYQYTHSKTRTENTLLPGYLKPETMANIWKPVVGIKSFFPESRYAMGWSVLYETHGQCRKSRHRLLHATHSGGAVGFSSVLLIAPSKKDENGSHHANGLNRNNVTKDSPSSGVVVAIMTNLGSTSLLKTVAKIGDIFSEL